MVSFFYKAALDLSFRSDVTVIAFVFYKAALDLSFRSDVTVIAPRSSG